jgi:N,N'-diacetylchitobiose phosphorylase
MQYGHFDDDAKEYVIDRPDTPRSWTNYLGDTTYGALISGNASGFAFYRSGNLGRFLRMRTNSVPLDQPGRYVYLRDLDRADVWTSSWQPVGKPLDEYQSTCRHGTAYTIISSRYRGIETEVCYFVPLGQAWEYWKVTVRNSDNQPRRLQLFPFVEWSSSWNRLQDLDNLQYSQYILDCSFHDGVIERAQNAALPEDPNDFTNDDQGRWNWMTLAGNPIDGFDTDRYAAIGPYNSYANPQVIMNGACTGSLAQGDNGVGVLQTGIELQPGEEKTILVMLGVGTAADGQRIREEFGNIERCDAEFDKLKQHWHQQIGRFVCETPNAEFNSWVNVWNAYNCLITFNWSRAASFVYNGDRDGFGYRDTVQDLMASSCIIPNATRDRLLLMISGQESRGSCMPEVKPYAHHPGQMPLTPFEKLRADDGMWLHEAVAAYVKETGDLALLDEVVPYADTGSDTVLNHLKKALEFTFANRGANGLPCGLYADWNDCLRMGFKGETVFVAHQFRLSCAVYQELCQRLGRTDEATWVQPMLVEIDAKIDACWEGDRWIRAITDQGATFGGQDAAEGKIFLNAQSWGVLSGGANPERAKAALDSVDTHLYTEYGIRVCDPGYANVPCNEIRAVLMNRGQKENGGIFNHPQGWAVMAACRTGDGDRAWKWYSAFMPASFNDKAEVRQVEPYVCCQSTHAPASRRFGAGRVGWLTGCATWAYWSATTHLLGVLPDFDGLRITPCLPAEWDQVRIARQFRGKQFRIHIRRNSPGKQVQISLNGTAMPDSLIPIDQATDDNDVTVTIG